MIQMKINLNFFTFLNLLANLMAIIYECIIQMNKYHDYVVLNQIHSSRTVKRKFTQTRLEGPPVQFESD